MKSNIKNINGYTLIEMMMVVAILSILTSVALPRVEILLQRAYQAKTKSNLGGIRTAVSIYYSDNEGAWPLAIYPTGDFHYINDGLCFSNILVPRYTGVIPTPKVYDRLNTFNGLSQSFDVAAETLMSMVPPKDVYIISNSSPSYTPFLSSPYAYDNQNGIVYIPNGNADANGHYYYDW